MSDNSEPQRRPDLIDRGRVRAIHTSMRETHAKDPRTAIIGLRGHIRQVDGYLLEGETGEPAHCTSYTLRQDLSRSMGGQGREPSALAYTLLGLGF